ncbi:MAG: alpha/beta hydrolase [Rhodopila sp.]
MTTTVYFATNRLVTNAKDPQNGYPATMAPPLEPDAMTYGVATVDQIDIPTNNAGVIKSITNVTKGDFSKQAQARISKPGSNLLIFVHGFDNSFSAGITRAAFNREWLAASGLPGTDTTVVAFSWPSLGKLLGFPILWSDYKADQLMARNSGPAMMTFLSRIQPALEAAAKDDGARCTLLAHSMGNLVLEAGLENWFLHGNGPSVIFNLAVLAAADCRYDTFDQPPTAGLKGLTNLADRTAIYYSTADQVLHLSTVVNLGAKRLGQDGPHNRADPIEFPPAQFGMHDCSDVRDYNLDPASSHQYYRMSPTVRASIASEMAGTAAVAV